MQAIPLVGSAAMSGANNNMQNGQGPLQAYADPGNFFNGNSAQAMDPLGYAVFNGLGIENWNPLQVLTNKVPGFHGNGQNANGANSVGPLPNLGAASMIPKTPGGAFMPINHGGGAFNNMANASAGNLFNPAGSKGAPGGKGGVNSPSNPTLPAPVHPMTHGMPNIDAIKQRYGVMK